MERKEQIDEEIVALCFARDEKALSLIGERYGNAARALCRNVLHSDEDAEECFNDTLLKIWQSIPPARPAHFGAYCLKIARHAALDRLRARAAGRRVPQRLVASAEDGEEPAAYGQSPTEDAALAGELTALLDRFLATLPERARLIFLYRHYFGEPVEKIALLAGCSERNVFRSLGKTKAQLDAFLKKEGYRP